jgi:hypothetical protein
VDGDSLEAALRDYGPAAIDDLLPRLRTIAEDLDAAHAVGQIHGSLHPQNIFVTADDTRIEGLDPAAPVADGARRPPYAAPEVVAGGDPKPASDQFSLAAIAHEWMFGRRIAGPAVRPIEVRSLPGVDRDALARAFTRALAPQAADRFASCAAFCAALEATVIPVLPLGVEVDEDALDTEFLPEDESAAPLDAEVETEAEIEAEAEAEALPPVVSDLDLADIRDAEPGDEPDDEAVIDRGMVGRDVDRDVVDRDAVDRKVVDRDIVAFEPRLSPPVEPVT